MLRRWLLTLVVVSGLVAVACEPKTPAAAAPRATPTPPRTPPPTPTPSPTLPPANPNASSAFCLGCHGPYEKVVQASANYSTQDGTKVNPHTTIDIDTSPPHASV